VVRVLAPGPMSAPAGAFTEPGNLVLPPFAAPAPPGGPYVNSRQVSLNEEESATVLVLQNPDETWVTPVVLKCSDPNAVPFGPTAALLGTVAAGPIGVPKKWADTIAENPTLGLTETWEIHNFTVDAHPIHIHLVQFQVVDRQPIGGGAARPREAWETGFKDTVITYPGEITRVQARFDIAGLYVWHCHIVEHEDNEMMRPYQVV
jgi:spore coat protein A